MKLATALKAALATGALAASVGWSAPAMAGADLRCDSSPGRYNYCRATTAKGVRLVTQHSRHPCYQNDTWGYDGGGIWVSNGCSATFRLGSEKGDNTAAAIGLGVIALAIIGAASQDDDDRRDDYPPSGPGPGPRPGPGYDDGYDDDYDDPYGDAQIVSCDSKNNKYRYCPVRVDDYAELVHQRSRSACRYGKTWGYDRGGVWVKKGCRGDFAVY